MSWLCSGEANASPLIVAVAALAGCGDGSHHPRPYPAGRRGVLSTVAAILAECMFRQGRFGDAEALLDEGEEKAADDDVVTHVLVRAGRAKLSALGGAGKPAEDLAGEARPIACNRDQRRAEWPASDE